MKKVIYILLVVTCFSCVKKQLQPKESFIPVPNSPVQFTETNKTQSESETAGMEDEEDEANEDIGGDPIADSIYQSLETEKIKWADYLNLVPKGYVVYEEIYADVDKDNQDDCILIIKGADFKNVAYAEYRNCFLDRNRRGIIIGLKRGDHYKPVVKNYSCFSSENEDGGVYYAPELYLEVNAKKNLIIGYAHGRYGYWRYMFRYQNNRFEMIGYEEESNRGPQTLSKMSINFSTKKMCTSTNLSQNEDYEDKNYVERWENTWEDLNNIDLIDLQNIQDFDNISFDAFLKNENGE